jgi:predicted glycoside hydrolase/deacetylase ChbG (UPF0249 family)
VVSLDDPTAVAAEAERQLIGFRRLVNRDPTHLDSHQHVHRQEPARSVLVELAQRIGVPLRHFTAAIRYCGDFYGQDAEGNSYPEILSTLELTRILASLQPGWTELACHPGEVAPETLDTMYVCERGAELQVLCDHAIRAALAELKIELRSFADVKQEGGPA